MKQSDHLFSILDLIDCPAFCVAQGDILRCNQAAQRFLLPENTPVVPLMVTGQQEYEEFEGGCLHLTMTLAGNVQNVTVNKLDGMDLFTVEQDSAGEDLHALALAAQTLRQPLSAMTLAAEALRQEETPETKAQLARIHKSMYQLSRLIENMSDAYSYSLHGAAAMELQDMIMVVREIFDSMAVLLQKADIRLEYEIPAVSVYGQVDRRMLERAIGNMLSNAVKYTPKGGAIRATLVRKNNMLILTIADTGEGFDESLRSNLFSQFRRDPGIEDGRKGLGLGLHLIRNAATAHGGTVLIHDSSNGSRITFTMAIRQGRDPILRSGLANWVDPTARDWGFIELADVLPESAFLSL